MTISAERLEVFGAIVFVITVDMIYVQLAWVSGKTAMSTMALFVYCIFSSYPRAKCGQSYSVAVDTLVLQKAPILPQSCQLSRQLTFADLTGKKRFWPDHKRII